MSKQGKGEGSHGGHVIGHTKKGRPIYAHGGLDSDHALSKLSGIYASHSADDLREAERHFPGWTANDHAQARDALRNHADKIERRAEGKIFSMGEGGRKQHSDLMRDSLNNSSLSLGHSEMAKFKRGKVAKSSGDGSRGGKVIGHTRSGKPIYQARPSTHSAYKGFQRLDHIDAANRHDDVAGELGGRAEELGQNIAAGAYDDLPPHEYAKVQSEVRQGEAAAYPHSRLAYAHRDAASKLTKSEGSHGGHVIGHTRSGKAIYASHHEKNAAIHQAAHDDDRPGKQALHSHLNYNANDHLDAADAHASRAHATPSRDERYGSHVLAQAHAEASIMMRHNASRPSPAT